VKVSIQLHHQNLSGSSKDTIASIAAPPIPSVALKTLMAGYDSSSADDDDEESAAKDNSQVEFTTTTTTTTTSTTMPHNIVVKDEIKIKKALDTFAAPSTIISSLPKTNNTKKEETTSKNETRKMKHCRYFLRNGTCKHGAKCKFLHDEELYFRNLKSNTTQQQQQKQLDKEIDWLLTPSKQQHTLLRKLLENDLQRERTLTLQLLRHIVDLNYFQKAN